jgi:hypothetical protein
MSGEVSYFSRFFVKFVEIVAAGLASAVSAYLLAHFGGLLLSSSTPASAPAPTAVQLGPTASEVAKSLRAQPTPPVAAAAVNEQRPAPQQDTDAPIAQPALRAVKDANALPPREHAKTDASVAEKRPPGQKSAEALARARAALANVDANRPASADALIGPGLTDTRPAPVDVQPRQADVPPRQADVRGAADRRSAPRCRHRGGAASRRRSAAAGAASYGDRRQPAAAFPRRPARSGDPCRHPAAAGRRRRTAATECRPAARDCRAPATASRRPGQGRVLRPQADPRSAAPRPAGAHQRSSASAHAGRDGIA